MEDWDAEAEHFDDEPDHGLTAQGVRQAWVALLADCIPERAAVLDLGCGTGTLSVLLAEGGHAVTGVDSSPAMVAQARSKAIRHGVDVRFLLGDAARPDVDPADVVLVRHVLWALSDAGAALDQWVALLRPGGQLLLIEGHWDTDAGIASDELLGLLGQRMMSSTVRPLKDPALWGRSITDERYLVMARPAVVS